MRLVQKLLMRRETIVVQTFLVLISLFSPVIADGASSPDPASNTPIKYTTNDVGCTEISVPDPPMEGQSSIVNRYYKIPPSLNPERLSNLQLATCGLPLKPSDRPRNFESYKKWLDLTRRIINTPLRIPATSGDKVMEGIIGDPDILERRFKPTPSFFRPGVGSRTSDPRWPVTKSPNFSGRVMYDMPSPVVTEVMLTTNLLIPPGPFGFAPTYTPYHTKIAYWAGYGATYPSFSNSLAQAGVVDEVTPNSGSSGFTRYLSLFAEFYPDPPMTICSATSIYPGDQLAETVTWLSGVSFSVTIVNTSENVPNCNATITLTPTGQQNSCSPSVSDCNNGGKAEFLVEDQGDILNLGGCSLQCTPDTPDYGQIVFLSPAAAWYNATYKPGQSNCYPASADCPLTQSQYNQEVTNPGPPPTLGNPSSAPAATLSVKPVWSANNLTVMYNGPSSGFND